MSRDKGWQGDTELRGWGEKESRPEVKECSAEDSECVMALIRQVSKGTYKERSLMNLIGRAKGMRPKNFPLYLIPIEVRRVGNRWGITYDIVDDVYRVWGGGEPHKGYIPRYRGDIPDKWMEIASDIIRHMPNKIMKWSTFVNYFSVVAANIGYNGGIVNIADCILQGRIKVPVELRQDGKIEVLGGHGDKRPIRRRN